MTTQINQNNIQPATLAELGSGPTVTNVQITTSSYVVLDDTAVALSGGYIKITGTNFANGCEVIIGTTNATSVAFVNSTTLNVQVPSLSAGTYVVYVVNTDGSVAIIVNGLTYSGTPTWVTGSTLPTGQVSVAISIQLSATGDAPLTYSLQAGSSLPSGVTLSSGGLLSGTVTGITNNTTYNFTIEAIDAESQESPRAFSITINALDQYFPNVTLLLSANTPSSTFVSDASTNAFNITVNGDTRPNNFGPYTPGYYSNYFDGDGDWLLTASSPATLSADFTIEGWVYITSFAAGRSIVCIGDDNTSTGALFFVNTSGRLAIFGNGGNILVGTSQTVLINTWNHIAFVRSSGTIRAYLNGVADSTTSSNSTAFTGINRIGGELFAGNAGGTIMLGYISNYRLVNGTAVYTANFTPSTTPLTAIANTSLLTCQSNRFIDNSTNNFTITVNGNTTINGFDPFVPASNTATYGSGYFDGTGDWLSLATNSAFDMGTGNFTLEAWVRVNALGGGQTILASSNADITAGYIFSVSSTGYLGVESGSGGYQQLISTSNPLSAGVWAHVAFTKSSGTNRFFVNGSLCTNNGATFNQSYSTGGNALTIGRSNYGGGTNYMTGYISNLRMLKGTALYTANFTPPTSPLTAITNTSLLTLQTNQPTNNNMFVDNSTNNFLITRNGNTTQGSFSPYPGTWSNYFDGTGDYLTIPNSSSLLFGSGNFTVETWVYPTAFAADRWIVGFWSYTAPANQSWALYMGNSTGGYGFAIQGDAGAEDLTILSAPSSVVLNQWTHVAVTRSGSSWRMFINGVQSATGTYGGTLASPSSVLAIAAVESVPQLYIGYISNLRVVKGTAVYTSAFTTPTQPLLPITNTSLLICADNRLIDDSPNNFTISRFGDTSVQKFSPFTVQTQIVPISYSVYFDGTGDWITTPNVSAFDLSNSATNFTIEAWVYNTGPGGNRGIFGARANGATSGWCLYISSSNTLNMGSVIVGQAYADRQMNATTIPGYAWTHVALVKDATGYVGYVNGVGGTKLALTGGLEYQSTQPVTVGALASQGELPFVGLISNARIVKGTAVYTANFTPPTSPLTAIANTSLLTCQSTTIIDNSSNAFTITVNGNSQPVSQNPFGYTNPAAAAYTTATLGGSMYFDGTGDYLTTPSNAAFNLSANFTVEGWIYPTSVTGARQIFTTRASAATGTSTAWGLAQSGSALIWFTTTANISGGTIALNAWNHVAAARSGSTLTLYLNGTSIGTATLSNNFTDQQLAIGACLNGNEPFIGYISDARIIKGQALYTSPFVPPAAPLTAVQNNVLLLNGTSAGVYDSSMINDYETVGDVRLNTSVVKYGNSSIFFDGTGDYTFPVGTGLNFTFGTGNFTIEFWCYLNATSAVLYDGRPLNTNGVYPAIYVTGGSLRYYVSTADRITSGSTLSTGIWYHIAVSRSSTSTKMFIDGTQTGSTYTDSNNYLGSTNRPVFGISAFDLSASALNGYLSDVRITNGIARYTANFTPPTIPFIQY